MDYYAEINKALSNQRFDNIKNDGDNLIISFKRYLKYDVVHQENKEHSDQLVINIKNKTMRTQTILHDCKILKVK